MVPRGKKLKLKIFHKSLGGPPGFVRVFRIHSGGPQGEKQNKKTEGPRDFVRYIPVVPRGKKQKFKKVPQISRGAPGVRRIRYDPFQGAPGIRSWLFGAFRWHIFANLSRGPGVRRIRSGLFGPFRWSPGVKTNENNWVFYHRGLRDSFGAVRSILAVPRGKIFKISENL